MGALEDTKREVLRATDIVSLIEQYVPLKRAGRSMTALCPFHQEKSASFHVSSERQTFKCFGCGKGGNAIDFVIEKEGVDFKTALRHLADKAGIRMPERGQSGGPDDAGARERKRLFEINEKAAEFYRMALTASRTGEHAREYVRSRGIDEETEERFQIGWAPADWSRLLDFLGKRGYAPLEVEKAGLAIPRKTGNGHFDRYRNRLMFPIHDIMGRVVSFGGRALAKEDNPKYMNGPETPIFHKGELCYALHLAKDAARARGEIAVVEGYVDVVLAHQAGFPWMVATLGTAFRAEHAKILARIASRLLVFFDGDAAGASANRRGLVEAGRAGMKLFKELKVALLPDGLDPADLVQQRGAPALDEAVKKAVSLSEFFLAAAGKTSADKAKAVEEVCEILASLDDEAYREIEIAATAHRFGVPEEVVRRLVKKAKEQAEARAANAAQQPARGHAQGRGPASASAPVEPHDAYEEPEARPIQGPLPRLERWLLECVLAVPTLLEDARARGIGQEWLLDLRARVILGALLEGRGIAEIEDAPARALAAEIAAKLDPEKQYDVDWRGVVVRLTAERDERAVASGTKGDQDELQETVARKLRREQMQRRVSLRGGELEDVNG